jgi:hypothetical protein
LPHEKRLKGRGEKCGWIKKFCGLFERGIERLDLVEKIGMRGRKDWQKRVL